MRNVVADACKEWMRVSISSSMVLTIPESSEKDRRCSDGGSRSRRSPRRCAVPLVDLDDRSRARALKLHRRKAKQQGGNQPSASARPTTVRSPDFIDVSSNHEHVAVRQTSRNQADRLVLPATFGRSVDDGALYRIVVLNRWQAFQVTARSAPFELTIPRAEHARILLQMLIDRVEPALRRQGRKDAHLEAITRSDRVVRSRSVSR